MICYWRLLYRMVFAIGPDSVLNLRKFPKSLANMFGQLRNIGGKHSTCEHKHSCISAAVEVFPHLVWYRSSSGSYCSRFAATWSLVAQVCLLCVCSLHFHDCSLRLGTFCRNWLHFPIFAFRFSSAASLCSTTPPRVCYVAILAAIVVPLQPYRVPSQVHQCCSFRMCPLPCTRCGKWSRYVIRYVHNSLLVIFIEYPFQTVYFLGVKAGKLPNWRHGDVALYTISTGFVLFSACIEPHSLRSGYYKFLVGLSGNRWVLQCITSVVILMFLILQS